MLAVIEISTENGDVLHCELKEASESLANNNSADKTSTRGIFILIMKEIVVNMKIICNYHKAVRCKYMHTLISKD